MTGEPGAAAPDFTEYAVDTKAYEELEQNFQGVIQELIGDRSLEKFRDEYERLHKALKRSHESNKRLITKCRELNEEILSNSTKVDRSLELLQQDRRTITALRQEIDKAWKMVETAQGREKKAGETIEALKAEIAHLTQLVEQGGLLSYGHDNTVKELLQQKEGLIRERDAQLNQIIQLRNELTSVLEAHHNTKQEKQQMEQKVQHLRGTLTQKRAQVESETLHRDRLVKQLQNLRSIQQNLANQIEGQNKEFATLTAEEERLNQAITDARAQIEQLREENHEAQKQEEDIDAEIKKETERSKELQNDLKALEDKLHEKEKEIRTIKNEIDRKSRENHTLQQNIIQTRHMCGQDEAELATLRTEVSGMEKEIAELNRSLAANTAEHEQLDTKKKALDATIAKTRSQLEKQQALTKEETEHRKELEGKLLVYQKESQEMKQLIDSLEKERERCAREAADAQTKYVKAKEDAKMSEIQLNHTQRLIQAAEDELKAKQQTYEQLRVERNNYNRQLVSAQDANVDLKKKFKVMTQQAQQLKNEIRAKEDTFASENFELKKAEGKKEKLESKMKRLKADWEAAEATMMKHQEELRSLEARIKEADAERQKLLDEQLRMMKDRDVLGTQLIRRNDEIALLYEKIKILQDTLKKGEIEYNKRCEDAAELQRLIKDTQRKNLILQRQCDQTEELEAKVKTLQKDLIQEQTRVRALSEELEDPNNPHRWRHLPGNDPTPAELLKTIKKLQLRLIQKTEGIVNTKKEIEDLKKQMASTKKLMDEQPSPEMLHKLKQLQLKVKEKDRQLKAMAAELNTQQSKLAEYQSQYEVLNKQLSDARDMQYSQKKVYNRLRERMQRTQVSGGTTTGEEGGSLGGDQAMPTLPGGLK
jgi:chromosome segregation ATPase